LPPAWRFCCGQKALRSISGGRLYALTLLVTSVTALGIYRRGIFFFPHWLAIAAPIVTTAGVLAAHCKRPQKA
jgi:hypothetical protein